MIFLLIFFVFLLSFFILLFFKNLIYLSKLDFLCETYFLITIQPDLSMLNSDKLLFLENLLIIRKNYISLVYNSLSIFMILSLLTIFKNKESLLLYIGLKFDEQISKKKFLEVNK